MMNLTLHKANLFEKLQFNYMENATIKGDSINIHYPKRSVKTYEYARKIFNDLVGKNWFQDNAGIVRVKRNEESITFELYSRIYEEVKAEIVTELPA